MAKRICTRCERPVGKDAASCGVCGLGEPDLERPLAVHLSVWLDAIMFAVLLAIGTIMLLVGLDVKMMEGDALVQIADALGNAWIPMGISFAFAILILVSAIGVRRGRMWGRNIQNNVAWLWFLGGVNMLIWVAIAPPTETIKGEQEIVAVAQAALWILGTVVALTGFALTIFLARFRPRKWFATLKKIESESTWT